MADTPDMAAHTNPKAAQMMTTTEQLATDILTTAVESGYPWFLYHEIDRDDDLNVTRALVEIVDCDDCTCPMFGRSETCPLHGAERPDAVLHVVDPARIRRTMNAIFSRRILGQDQYRELARAVVFGDDDVDFDVVDADNILQLAVMGEIVYA